MEVIWTANPRLWSRLTSRSALAFVPVVEVACAEILVEGAIFEHVVGGCEDRSGYSADGLLRAAPGADAQVLGLEVASLRSELLIPGNSG